MQRAGANSIAKASCFYLSKRRQMQQPKMKSLIGCVVFTFQKEGRCNSIYEARWQLPVVFTFQKEGRCNHQQQFSKHLTLFLPFKKKADATTGN